MELDYKSLERLAKACRKAGIKRYKCADFEFELADLAPESKPRGKAAQKPADNTPVKDADLQFSDLSEEEQMFWSAPVPIANVKESNEN